LCCVDWYFSGGDDGIVAAAEGVLGIGYSMATAATRMRQRRQLGLLVYLCGGGGEDNRDGG
jgi:hypothetical protein